MIDNWKDDLLKEKSLREAYVVSRALARSTFNKWAFRLSVIVLSCVGVIWVVRGDVKTSYDSVMLTSGIGFDLTVQILGFLIGGFAIFATISDSKLMVRLAKTTMPRTGLSIFKTIFFNFISVFYIYVVTLALAVITKVASSVRLFELGFLRDIAEVRVATVTNAIAFVVLGAAVTLSILRLKSFIWNIYQAYLTLLIASEMPEKPAGGGPAE